MSIMYPDYSNNGNNPYEFIMNPAKPPKKSPLGTIVPKGNPMMMRIIMVVGGLVVLMVVIALGSSLLSRGGLNTVPLVGLAQTQNELVRVATEASTQTVQQSAKNLAVNIELGVTTQQQTMLTFLGKQGQKLGTKDLALKQNATTDQQLTSAKAQSTYDEVFSQLMQTQLQAYANALKTAYAGTKSTSERSMLSTFYTQAELLMSQVPTQASLNTGN